MRETWHSTAHSPKLSHLWGVSTMCVATSGGIMREGKTKGDKTVNTALPVVRWKRQMAGC